MVSFLNVLSLTLFAVTGIVADTAIQTQNCTDVHLVFARGTNQPPGLGTCGIPLFNGLKAALPDKTVSAYAVDYAADTLQLGAGKGATDMTDHIVAYAAACPKAVFVVGGYSQGASVTDIAIGIDTILGHGHVIPSSLAPRIKAVVTFGNPLRLFMETIEESSPLYGSKSIDYCNKGDPVCARGVNGKAHKTYPTDSVPEAAIRAAAFVKGKQRHLRTQA